MPSDPFLWADTDGLVDVLGYDQAMAERAVANASWMLWALSGRQLHGQGTRVDLYRLVPYYQAGRRDFLLNTRPVRDILTVDTITAWTDDVTSMTEGTEWTHYGNRIVLAFGAARHDRVKIVYTVKSNLPPGTYEVVLKLAEEYLKAANNLSCSLPQRVTTVTRQGISWTILDPADFLDKGLSGVIPIDSWLSAVNPRRNKQRTQVFDPRAPILLSSTWLAEPFDSDDLGNGASKWYGHGALEDLDPDWLDSTPQDGDTYVDVDSGETYTYTAPVT